MVKGQSYRVKGSGEYLQRSEVDLEGKTPVEASTGRPLVVEWEKMSKSKFNGVDPSHVLEHYGLDMTRMLILSDVSPHSDRKWNPEDSALRIVNMQRRLVKLVFMALERQENIDKVMKNILGPTQYNSSIKHIFTFLQNYTIVFRDVI